MNNEIRDENYLIITGWMVNKLDLSGADLFVYALIYQFSQDGYSRYYGGRKYIAKWFNCSINTIDRALDSLVKKNYIIKETYKINNVTYNRYKCNLDLPILGIPNLGAPPPKSNTNTINNNNNINNNNIYNTINKKEIKENNSNKLLLKEKQEKKSKFTPPTLEEIEQYIQEKKYSINPKVFFDYFKESNWHDSEGKPVKNWKQKIITWENKNKKSKANRPIPEWFNQNIEETESNIVTNDDFEQFIQDFRKTN